MATVEAFRKPARSDRLVFGKEHLDYLTSEFTSYYNTRRAHMERDHPPPVREEPNEVDTLTMDQIVVKSYVGGLVKSFERQAAWFTNRVDDPNASFNFTT